jgi:hypothetical protein
MTRVYHTHLHNPVHTSDLSYPDRQINHQTKIHTLYPTPHLTTTNKPSKPTENLPPKLPLTMSQPPLSTSSFPPLITIFPGTPYNYTITPAEIEAAYSNWFKLRLGMFILLMAIMCPIFYFLFRSLIREERAARRDMELGNMTASAGPVLTADWIRTPAPTTPPTTSPPPTVVRGKFWRGG